jgi:DNA-binding NarL/FixJ family response regulator
MTETHASLLERARTLLLAADYIRASQFLAGCEDWSQPSAEGGVLAKAELLLQSEPVTAVAWLASVRSLIATDAGRFAYNLLAARAFAVVRNASLARARLRDAERFVGAVENGREQIALYRARFRWYAGRSAVDDRDLVTALGDPDPNGRALAYLQRAWAHAANEAYAEQTEDLRASLAVVDEAGVAPNVKTRAMIIFVLARLAFERADAEGIAHAQRAFDTLAWTPAVAVERYQALRAFGWDAFMRGSTARAQWIFREAREVAPSDAWRAMAHLDRAHVARIEGNEAWALDELYEAHAVAQRIVWAQTANEERTALVTFAELFANVDAARAQWYAATYSAMGLDGINPNYATSRERRVDAEERFVNGTIERAVGNREAAVDALTDAYALFASIDHHFKAGLAASALAEATGDPSWTARAVEHVGRYPGSPLARSVAKTPAERTDPIFETLTPTQREVARGMCEGLDTVALSERFSRSIYTIEREVSAVHAAFGTDSNAALRAIANERGIA